MNEKRFITIDHSTCVFDKITKEEYVCIDREEAFLVCKRLNEQQSIIDEQKIAIDEMITDYKNLEKENEQLRKENVFLAKQRNYWKGKCDMAVETFKTDEATEKKISELEKENEQLQKEKEYYREYALQYLLEYEFYSDNFLNTIKNTISEEEVKKIKEEENKIIEALKKEGLYE